MTPRKVWDSTGSKIPMSTPWPSWLSGALILKLWHSKLRSSDGGTEWLHQQPSSRSSILPWHAFLWTTWDSPNGKHQLWCPAMISSSTEVYHTPLNQVMPTDAYICTRNLIHKLLRRPYKRMDRCNVPMAKDGTEWHRMVV